MAEANWYVAHTYSGYENKVKANIEKTIENRHLEDQILGSKPVPLSEEEIGMLGIQPETIEIDFAEGDSVVVTGGAWKDTTGIIQTLNSQKQTVTINVELFGRETPVEISFAEIKKL